MAQNGDLKSYHQIPVGFVVASELLPYICKRKIDFYEDFIQFLIEQSILKPEV